MNNYFVLFWLILTYLFFIVAYYSKLSRRAALAIPTLLSAVLLAAVLIITSKTYRSYSAVISAVDVGQGQSICFMSGNSTVMIDCGSSATLYNAGEKAGEYLLSCGRNHVDVLLLTHLHRDHTNGVTALLELVDIDKIIISDKVRDDDAVLDDIIQSAKKHGTEIVFISGDTLVKVGKISMQLFEPADEGDSNEMCIFSLVSSDGHDLLVTGDAGSEAERKFVSENNLDEVDFLIAGHHGSKYSSTEELINSITADTVIISCGYNIYGHPTQEVLNRFNKYGYKIYRTDLNGTVEIRIKNGRLQ